jgi:hypothetical protein
MKNNVIALSTFSTAYKRFLKKFPNLKTEFSELEKILTAEPKTGESLGAGLYKIRLASKDKNSGKSGGFRVITYLVTETESETNVYLLKIYDKSEDATFKTPLLIKLVKSIFG